MAVAKALSFWVVRFSGLRSIDYYSPLVCTFFTRKMSAKFFCPYFPFLSEPLFAGNPPGVLELSRPFIAVVLSAMCAEKFPDKRNQQGVVERRAAAINHT